MNEMNESLEPNTQKLGIKIPENQNNGEKKSTNVLVMAIIEVVIYVALYFAMVVITFMFFAFRNTPEWWSIIWLIIYFGLAFKLSKGRFYSTLILIIVYIAYIAQYVPGWRVHGYGSDLEIFLKLIQNDMGYVYFIILIALATLASYIFIKTKGALIKFISKKEVNNNFLSSKVENQIDESIQNKITKQNNIFIFSKLVKTILIIVIFCSAVVIIPKLVITYKDWQISTEINKQDKDDNGDRLASMALAVCGKYSVVYNLKEYPGQGIFECDQTNYLYYIKDYHEQSRLAGIDDIGEMYQIGYVYHEEIEKIFPNGIYIYRQTGISGMPSELKIAVEAENEKDLTEKYSEKFYQLIKLMNNQYKSDLILTVYFNKTLAGIDKTYDKLFLYANYNPNNIIMENSFREYTFQLGNPKDLFNNIFSNPNNYPNNARNALKYNKHIGMVIQDGQTVTFDDFVQKFKLSLKNPLK